MVRRHVFVSLASLSLTVAAGCGGGSGGGGNGGTFLTPVSGDGQSGTVGQALAAPVVVVIKDANGNPIKGATVDAVVTQGGGSVATPILTTDATGQASTAWTLGSAPGLNELQLTAGNVTGGSPATFQATAKAGAPASLMASGGNQQSGVAGTLLPSPLVVTVLDSFGNPVPGVSVGFGATGGGSLSAASVTSDAHGQAQTSLTLGVASGLNTVTATAMGASQASFTETGLAGPAAAVAIFGGNNQNGTVGGALAAPLVVLVTDINGNPVPGASVAFAVATGGGTLSSTGSLTGPGGKAQTILTLGHAAGGNSVVASAGGTSVTFAATAAAGTASQLVQVSGSGQLGTAGAALAAPFVVEATDLFGNPVAGVAVTFAAASGGGSMSSGSVTTGANGLAASTLTLGVLAGANTATASVSGLSGSPLTFNASGNPGAATQLSILSGGGQTGTVGQAVPGALVAAARDANGNGVAGVSVSFAVAAGGGSVGSTSAVTNSQGLAQTGYTLGTKAGLNTVSASAAGPGGALSGSPVSFGETGNAGAPAQIVASSGSGQSGAAGTQLGSPLVATVEDAFGNPVGAGAATVAFAVGGGGGSVQSPGGATNASGQVSTKLNLGSQASQNGSPNDFVTATAAGVPGSAVFSATTLAGAAFGIAFLSQPGNLSGGQLIPAYTVGIVDSFGNPVANAGVPIAIAMGTNPGGGTLSGNTFVLTGAGGSSTFGGTSIDKAGNGYTLSASAPGLGLAASQAFNVLTGGAAGLAILSLPVTATAGAGFSVSVGTVDAGGNPVTTSGVAITAGLLSSPSGTSFNGPSGAVTAGGTAVFSGFTATRTGRYVIGFNAPGLSGISTSATVQAGPATLLTLSGIPNPFPGGVSGNGMTVAAFDAFGNLASSFTDTVAFTSTDKKAVLPGPYTFTGLDGGTHLFPVNLFTLGSQTVSVADISSGSVAGGNQVVQVVLSAPRVISVGVPSVRGCVPVSYDVAQAGSLPTDIEVDFDADGTGVFTRATQCGAAPGTVLNNVLVNGVHRVSTAPGGVLHSFLWNTNGDLRNRNLSSVGLRVTPVTNGVKGSAFTLTGLQALDGMNFSNTSTSAFTGAAPNSVLVADVNGDGLPDIITANFIGNSVSVLLQQANGTYANAPGSPIAVGPGPVYVAVGDFNRDGKLDMAVPNSASNTVSILLGNGDGSFTAGTSITVGTAPVGIAAGDVNGDGKPDLVVANWNNGTVAGSSLEVLLGNGDGTFVAQPLITAGFTVSPWSPVLADLNRDGILDVLVANQPFSGNNCNVSALMGNGAGGFVSFPGSPFSTGGCVQNIAVGDFNGDGILDFAVDNYVGNQVEVLQGFGNGTFGLMASFFTPSTTWFVAAADLNGDGRADLVYGTLTGSLEVLTGTPTAPFFNSPVTLATRAVSTWAVALADMNRDGQPDLVIDDVDSNQEDVVLNTQPAPGDLQFNGATMGEMASGTQTGLVVADLNQDGKPDVVISTDEFTFLGDVSDLLAEGDGTFARPSIFLGENTPLGVSGMASADLNGDGFPDLVWVQQSDNSLQVYLGNSGASFPQRAASIPTGPTPSGVALGDFNGDGIPDVAVSNQGGNSVTLYLGLGDGSLAPGRSFPAGTAPSGIVVADINGDGFLDVVTSNQGSNDVSVLLGDGAGGLGPPRSVFAGSGPIGLAVGDFDGDGAPDVAVADKTGNAYSLLYNFGGALGFSTTIPLPFSPQGIAAGDLNGDGLVDLVPWSPSQALPSLSTSTRGVFDPTPAVSLQTPTTFAGTSGLAGALLLADMNGDGAQDLVVATGQGARVFAGTGTGLFRTSRQVAAASFAAAAVADFNQDGKPDFVAVSSAANEIAYFSGDGRGDFTNYTTVVAGTNPVAVAVGDVNGDGKPDVVTANAGGSITVALGGANGVPASVNTTPLGGALPTSLALGDLNRDGKLDLVTGNQTSGTVTVLSGNGAGTFTPVQTIPMPAGFHEPVGVALADFNGDGILDLAVATQGSILVFKGTGIGTFTTPAAFQVGTATEETLVVGDFNGDGKPDIVIGDCCDQEMELLLNTGTLGAFAFSGPSFFFHGQETAPPHGNIIAADMNHDGKLDLVLADGDGTTVAYANGTSGFNAFNSFFYGRGGSFVVVADFNGDGLPDLVVGDPSGTGEIDFLAGR